MEGPIINTIQNLKDDDNIYKINEQPFVVNAIENLSFIKDFTKLSNEKDREIGKFLMDSAKNSPNFEESITLVKSTTDLIYRPLTIEDFFIKEVNPRTLTQNTILSHLCRNGKRKIANLRSQPSWAPSPFIRFLKDLEFFFNLLKEAVKDEQDELNRIKYVNQMFKIKNGIQGKLLYESVLGSISSDNIPNFYEFIELITNNGFDINTVDITYDLYTGETHQKGNMLTYLTDRAHAQKEYEIKKGDHNVTLTSGALNALTLKEKGIDDMHRPTETKTFRYGNSPTLYHFPVSSRNQRVPYGYINKPSTFQEYLYSEAQSKRGNIYDVLQTLARMNSKQKLALGKIINDENTPGEFYDMVDLIAEQLKPYDRTNPFLGDKKDSNGEINTLGERLLIEDKYDPIKGGKRTKSKKRNKSKKQNKSKKRNKSKKQNKSKKKTKSTKKKK